MMKKSKKQFGVPDSELLLQKIRVPLCRGGQFSGPRTHIVNIDTAHVL